MSEGMIKPSMLNFLVNKNPNNIPNPQRNITDNL